MGCRSRSASKDRGPWLRIEGKKESEPEGLVAWRGLSLAVRALPEEQRGELLDAIREWLATAEMRHDPLRIELEDEPPAPLERVRSWFLPVWNAATALEARRWALPGGNFQVSVVRDGAPSGGLRTFRAWDPPTEQDSLIVGARFVAWPVTHGRLMDASTLDGLARLKASVGVHLCDPASRIGLLVDRSMLDRSSRCPELDAIRRLADRARRLASRFGPSESDELARGLLEHVPESEPTTAVRDWLDLGTSEVFVIPRLGALASRAAFDDELRSLRAEASLPR